MRLYLKKFFLTLELILILFSCGTAKNETTIPISTSEKQELIGIFFESKKGVMHQLSCHAYNIGYLSTDSKNKVIICFDRMENSENIEINCSKISVTGNFEDHEIKNDENGVCSASKLSIFYVSEWKCL